MMAMGLDVRGTGRKRAHLDADADCVGEARGRSVQNTVVGSEYGEVLGTSDGSSSLAPSGEN